MKIEEMNFEERREYFRQTIRGGKKSTINKKRTEEAKKFHKRFHEKMENEEIVEDIEK